MRAALRKPAYFLARWLFLFLVLLLTHASMLLLPYFWDEAGFYVPAAHDLYAHGSLVPLSTMPTGHPPLTMAYLALAWKLLGYTPPVTRVAMLLVSAFALTGIFYLARRAVSPAAAVASVACVMLYPVFFAQSPMALMDMPAAAFTFWGLYFYLERRPAPSAAMFAFAMLSKETAAITPMALIAWELWQAWRARKLDWAPALALAASGMPLAAWFLFHHARTGFFFGNPEYFRYNVSSTLEPARILFAAVRRFWQFTGYMNLLLLTLAAVTARFLTARQEKQNDAPPLVPAVFWVVLATHFAFFTLIGGAILARYLLTAVPLVIIICMAALSRTVRGWPIVTLLVAAGFVLGLVVDPPYVFAPEDNLAWRDFVAMHQRAAIFLEGRYPGARVLSAWPGTDEISRPELGYVRRPIAVTSIEDFSLPQMQVAAQAPATFNVVYIFSTKYEPERRLPMPAFWRRAQERYFGYHRDLTPEQAVQLLGGKIVYREGSGALWVAVIEVPRAQMAGIPAPRAVHR